MEGVFLSQHSSSGGALAVTDCTMPMALIRQKCRRNWRWGEAICVAKGGIVDCRDHDRDDCTSYNVAINNGSGESNTRLLPYRATRGVRSGDSVRVCLLKTPLCPPLHTDLGAATHRCFSLKHGRLQRRLDSLCTSSSAKKQLT